MSILNVNKINPVGGGSTVTIAGIASVTNNISVGNSVTASEFYGDGSGLTNTGAISAIASDGANRVLTSDGDGTATAHSFVTIESNRLSVNRGSGSGAFPLIVRRTDASGIIAEFANSSGYGLLIGQNSATGEAYLRTGTGQPLVITTNAGSGIANEKLRITSDGRLLVGRTNNISVGGDASDHCFEQITNNGYTLTIHANQTNQRGLGMFYTSGKTPEAFMLCQVDTSNRLIIFGSGNVQNANNSYGQISDQSLKENIVDAKSQWNDVKNLKIRNFNFKSSTGYDTHTQIGLVAQEVETVCPKLVGTNEDGTKNVASSVLYMKAVKALQEAQARIETLEAKVAALEGS